MAQRTSYADGPSPGEEAGNWLGNLFKPVADGWNDWLSGKSGDDYLKKYHNSPEYQNNRAQLAKSADIQPAAQVAPAQTGITSPSPNAADYYDAQSAPQQDQGSGILEMLKAAINNPGAYDAGPYMANLDQARSASLKAIADTRNQTQSNFDQSNAAIGGIYAKGKQDTLADNQVLKDNNAGLVGGLKGMYEGATQSLQADRTKEMSDKADMMSRLGIQGGGLGSAGETQTHAIADASQNSQAAQDKALQYGGADVSANTARAEGLISEGSGRQAQLRSQLSGILGQLSGKELDINNQYAQSSMQARNQAYQDNLSKISSLYGMYDKEQSRAQSQQNSILKSPVIAKLLAGGSSGANSMTGLEGANNLISQQGANPQDYNSAYSDAIMGAQTVPGTDPTDGQLLAEMVNKGMDRNLALSYIRAAKQSKSSVSTGNSGIDPSILAMLMGSR